jgi:CRISPR-associated protein Csb3
MALARFPAHPANPGVAFACLGLLELADLLCPGSEGWFEQQHGEQFALSTPGPGDPLTAVFDFLCACALERWVPPGQAPSPAPASSGRRRNARAPALQVRDVAGSTGDMAFPADPRQSDDKAWPLRLRTDGVAVLLSCWCDGSSRGDDFKLFAGQQQAHVIAAQMLQHIRDLWQQSRQELRADPFMAIPLGGGSFKLDARKAWTALDAGYSPDKQGHLVQASPVVELLGAIGLEHARPARQDNGDYLYGVWYAPAPPVLARAALGAAWVGLPVRHYRFALSRAGQNKVVTFAEEVGGDG